MNYEDRELIKLLNAEGLSDLQISKEIDIPVSSVKYVREKAGLTNNTTLNTYKELYKGSVKEVQERLIKLMQEAPVVNYNYFNSSSSKVPPATIYRKYFGSWTKALEAAGIEQSCTQKEDKVTILYLLEFTEGFYKIGITQQSIKERFAGYPEYSIIMTLELPLKEAKVLEKQWLNNVKEFKYIPTNFPAQGRGFTECFKY